MNRRPLSFLVAVCLLASAARAQDVKLESHPTRWRFTSEYFGIGGGSDLGLVGVHYDLLSPWKRVPELYAGVGGYGAVAGDRGGIFVGGVSVGWLQALSPDWSVDAGVFAGGGGGGGGPTSSGLVLRPYVGLERNLGLVALRLELAQVDFVDDSIDDVHLALGITLPSELLLASPSSRRKAIPTSAVTKRNVRISPLVRVIDSSRRSSTTKGRPLGHDVTLTGIGLDYFLSRHLFVPLEASGAVGGAVAGLATAATGLGWSLPLVGDHAQLELEGLVGAAGGGQVDVGGGLTLEGRGGIRARLYGPLSLFVLAGYLDAPDGDFSGASLTGGLTWSSNVPELGFDYPRSHLDDEGLPEARAKIRTTRVQLLNKTYVPRRGSVTVSGRPYANTLDLIGVGVEQPVLGDLSLLGRAYAAWKGGVGGYAEGLFGAKYEITPLVDERHHFSISFEAGPAGGGGVDVGSGLIWQFLAGWRYDLGNKASLSLEAGSMRSRRGTFSSETFQVGLSWALDRAYLK